MDPRKEAMLEKMILDSVRAGNISFANKLREKLKSEKEAFIKASLKEVEKKVVPIAKAQPTEDLWSRYEKAMAREQAIEQKRVG